MKNLLDELNELVEMIDEDVENVSLYGTSCSKAELLENISNDLKEILAKY